MRIGVNVFGVVPGSMGGVESYFRNVFANISAVEGGDEFTLICDERSAEFHGLLECGLRGLNVPECLIGNKQQ